jgi:hypothetical protein
MNTLVLRHKSLMPLAQCHAGHGVGDQMRSRCDAAIQANVHKLSGPPLHACIKIALVLHKFLLEHLDAPNSSSFSIPNFMQKKTLGIGNGPAPMSLTCKPALCQSISGRGPWDTLSRDDFKLLGKLHCSSSKGCCEMAISYSLQFD